MKSKRLKRREPVAPGAFRLLSPEEMDSLRQEMQASSQWMKAEIERRRFQGVASNVCDQLSYAPQPRQILPNCDSAN